MDHGKGRLKEVISILGKMTMSIIKTSECMNKHQLLQELLLCYLLHNGANKQEYEGEVEDVTYLDSHKKPIKLPRYLKKVSFAN